MIVGGTLNGPMMVRRYLGAMLQGRAMEPNAVDRGFQLYTTADIIMS